MSDKHSLIFLPLRTNVTLVTSAGTCITMWPGERGVGTLLAVSGEVTRVAVVSGACLPEGYTSHVAQNMKVTRD